MMIVTVRTRNTQLKSVTPASAPMMHKNSNEPSPRLERMYTVVVQ
jgi:biotin synthase-related radical SAM superfamily protein